MKGTGVSNNQQEKKTYVALLRGVNVGGKNVLPAKELVALLEGMGLQNARSYIQSGNAVFQATEEDPAALSDNIGAQIEKSRGFKPQVIVLGLEELRQAIALNPFPEATSQPKTLHVFFALSVPPQPNTERLSNLESESERFKLIGRFFYLFAPHGIGRSKLAANVERALGVPVTGRNWRTVHKLVALAEENAP